MHAPPRRSPRLGEHSARSWFSLLIATAIAIGLIAGCNNTNEADDDPGGRWSPFHSQSVWSENEGSLKLSLAGYERGHEPGDVATFELSLENHLARQISGTVCTYLVDEREIVLVNDKITMDLSANQVISFDIEVAFPNNIERRAYGLAVVFNEWGAMVHTIRVGIPDDVAGPWLDARDLTCD